MSMSWPLVWVSGTTTQCPPKLLPTFVEPTSGPAGALSLPPLYRWLSRIRGTNRLHSYPFRNLLQAWKSVACHPLCSLAYSDGWPGGASAPTHTHGRGDKVPRPSTVLTYWTVWRTASSPPLYCHAWSTGCGNGESELEPRPSTTAPALAPHTAVPPPKLPSAWKLSE